MPASLATPYGFPNGVPVPGGSSPPLILTLPLLTKANVFFTDSSHSLARDAASHGSIDRPFATLNYAVSRCTTGAGDTVIAAPGHTETIVAAGGLAINKAGVTLLGLGEWGNRPLLTFTTATTASVLVSSIGCLINNFRINLNGVDALANPFNIQAADFALANCRVNCADATNQAVLAILTNASADRLRIVNNRFMGTADAGMTAVIRLVGGDGHSISDNQFIGAYTSSVGAIQGLTTACTGAFIERNLINNLTASSTKAMVFVTGSTGMIANNRMQILSGTAPITGDAMSWVGGNYYSATIAQLGVLI